MSTARKPARTAAKTPAKRKPRSGAASKAPAKPAAKPAAKSGTARKPAKPAKPEAVAASPAVASEAAKPPKHKLVRDSFTMPKSEYLVIDALKQRSAQLGRPLKKSEVLRAGVKALAAMSDFDFSAAIEGVPALKTGRPKSKKTPEQASLD